MITTTNPSGEPGEAQFLKGERLVGCQLCGCFGLVLKQFQLDAARRSHLDGVDSRQQEPQWKHHETDDHERDGEAQGVPQQERSDDTTKPDDQQRSAHGGIGDPVPEPPSHGHEVRGERITRAVSLAADQRFRRSALGSRRSHS